MRPVAEQRPLDPRLEEIPGPQRQRRHARPAGLGVVADELQRLVGVLGAVDVVGVLRRLVREVDEAVAGPQVRRAAAVRPRRALDEAQDVLAVVQQQQVAAAGELGRQGVELAVPVDLVEPHVRVAEERPAGAAVDPVGDERAVGVGEPERRGGAVGGGQRLGDLGVDRLVLHRVRIGEARDPAGDVEHLVRAVGRGALLAVRRALAAERLDEQPGALVAPRRAVVPGGRRDGVDQEHVGVDRRGVGVGDRGVGVGRRLPAVLQALHQPVDERPVVARRPAGRGRRQRVGRARAEDPPRPRGHREPAAERQPAGEDLATGEGGHAPGNGSCLGEVTPIPLP